jgi:hypothetical protein
MIKPIMRVGDPFSGICTAHSHPTDFTGVFTQDHGIGTASGRAIVRIGDTAPTSCGHTIQVTTGGNTIVSGIRIHREGDTGIVIQGGSYTAGTGDPLCQCD